MAELGIRKTHDNLKHKLADYIKAQYFAENDLLMNASDNILDEKGIIYQEPFVEITKSYKQKSDGFISADIGEEYKNILSELTEKGLGVFNTPFAHQVSAMEHFCNGDNILVTTGTGSGKTECFVWPILSSVIYEARNNKDTWEKEGIRALILYPMNALVSDQLGRLRKIMGREDDAYYKLMSTNESVRRPRFGMYTGRTPYAGENDNKKNKELSKVIKANFLNNKALDELKKIGRVPAKDMNAFAECLALGYQNTDDKDAELYTRLEMQTICPDILVTNYSMLEYMLMRPIEDSLWNKTIDWLNASDKNKLTLVIDEAHMYRGAPGGEVSLLIRRLIDRLGIEPEKVQCILTSASVPLDRNDELQIFAQGLTGQPKERKFAIIREDVIVPENNKRGNYEEALFWASLSMEKLQGNLEGQCEEIRKIANYYNISLPIIKNAKGLANWLYKVLDKELIIRQILKVCSKGGKALSEIAVESFDDTVNSELAEKALEILLQLGIMSKSETGKTLVASKVHMMFRGIQGIFACVNPDCEEKNEGMGLYIGHITHKNIEKCPYCGGRMFELMMDRRCGTLYLRGFIDTNNANMFSYEFLWPHRNEIMKVPQEVHLWLVPENRTDLFKLNKSRGKAKDKSTISYLDSMTGMLFRDESNEGKKGFIKVLASSNYSKESRAFTFETCPNCGKDFNKITPFVTRGNEPFANIVKEQFESQPATDLSLINEGKKVLLFSDSRQRAATLARDMTVAADGDAGRQAIFMAQKLLDDSRDSEKTIDLLYYAFLKVVYDNKVNFFYGDEKEDLKKQLKKYEEFYSDRPKLKFRRMKDNIGNPPKMFYQLLLKNICDSYRSYNNLGLAQVVLAESGDAGEDLEYDILDKVEAQTGFSIQEIRDIYNTWIQYLLIRRVAIFPEVTDEVRNSFLSFERGGFGIDESTKFPDFMRDIFIAHEVEDGKIDILLDKFEGLIQPMDNAGRNHNRRYILGPRLELKTAENSKWFKCDRCAGTSTYLLWGHCIYCGSDKYIQQVDKEHLKKYELWRKPVIDALNGKKIKNIVTEEHTAQLSYKDNKSDVWGTTEKYELAFRNIILNPEELPIDVLSCTTTMEVGIDIGSLTSVGLRNVPPMRENYQQRAGRAGRAGAAVSSIVTYTENGPHDAWYFNHPEEIISGEPRTPWIDGNNTKLIKRHINLILLEEYLREKNHGLDEIYTIDFFDGSNNCNYKNFIAWVNVNIPFDNNRTKVLIPEQNIDWNSYKEELVLNFGELKGKIDAAEFMYKPQMGENNMSDTYRLMDVLFAEGMLPNYSFPRNIVHFWLEDTYGIVKESPERSIDVALSEYAPGRSLVVNKQTYISGGLYDYYTKYQKENKYKAAEPWIKLKEYNRNVQCCKNYSCGWFGADLTYKVCPLCNGELLNQTMIKPWGFAAREGKKVPETQESLEVSFASTPSYSSMPSGTKMLPVGRAKYAKIENRENQKLVIVNKGTDDRGFYLCSLCGAIEPDSTPQSEREKIKRPYRLPWVKDDTMRCRHEYQNVFLGYEFNTDMMVMEIELDALVLDLDSPRELWLIPALTTFSEALALGASRELDVEFNDIKSGYRIRSIGNKLFADVYLYDSLSSGAGYANRVTDFIENVLVKMEEIMLSCNCSTACPNCLLHFGNQRVKDSIDRQIGLDFLRFIRDGKLKTEIPVNECREYIFELNTIARLHNMDEVIIEEDDCFYLNNDSKREIIIYPSMCNLANYTNHNVLYFSDRMCKYAISDIWYKIQKLF